MKRFLTTILLVATLTGVFAPVTASMTLEGVAIHTQVALADPTTAPATTSGSSDEQIQKNSKKCGVGFFDDSTIGGCIIMIVYWMVYQLGGFLMHLSAWIFDALAAVSLSSTAYTSSTFITDGWRITRDFSNVFFILILLYAALSMILDLEFGHANPKKMVASVIIIAIVINFSMFIAGIVIDTSNTLALVFYNQINVTSNVTAGTVPDGQVQPTSISEALVQAFQPQQLQTKEFWENLASEKATTNHTGAGALTGAAIGSIIPGVGTVIGAGVGALAGYFLHTETGGYAVSTSTMIAVLLLVGIMFMVVAYSFFIAAISFVGRMIGLWVAIIFAPFAFVSYIIPSTQHIRGIGWDDWWKNLVSTAFAAPLYFFFLYLIALMMRSSIVSPNFMKSNGSTTGLVIIIISFLVLITMLLKATSYVKEAAGEIGGMVFKGLQFAGGAASAVALGGIAFGARRTLGKGASDFINNDTNKDLAAGRVNSNSLAVLKNKFGEEIFDKDGKLRKVDEMSHEEIKNTKSFQTLQRDSESKMKLNQKLASNSFDLRQTAVGGKLAQATGMDMSGFGAFSTARSAGGWDGEKARKAEKVQKFAQSLGNSHAQQDAFDDVIGERKEQKELLEEELKVTKTGVDALKAALQEEEDALQKLKSGGGTLSQIDDQEAKVAAAKVAVQTQQKAVNEQQIKIKEVQGGTGAVYTTADIGKTMKADGKTPIKADGTAVTANDVARGVKTTDGLSIAELERMKTRNEKDHMKSYAHMKMLQSGYEVHGSTYDSLGQIKKMGHMDFNHTSEAMRGYGLNFREMNKSLSKGLSKDFSKTFKQGAIDIADQFKDVFSSHSFLGALRETVDTTKRNSFVTNNVFNSNVMRGQVAQAGANFDHAPHVAHDNYAGPKNSGFGGFLSGLLGGGGGGGGGSHGGGHGGH